jgi:hypothetical protein
LVFRTVSVPLNQNPFGVLHIKLKRTSKELKAWSKNLLPQGKITLAICREVIKQLENRQLSLAEHSLVKILTTRILGLTEVQRCRARQKFRLVWLRLGYANTKYFHLVANQREKRNHIHSIETEEGIALTQAAKQKAILHHFDKHLGTYIPRACRLNFDGLGWPRRSLHHLETSVLEKALGLDGLIGGFFSECWDIIKIDLMRVVNFFMDMN